MQRKYKLILIILFATPYFIFGGGGDDGDGSSNGKNGPSGGKGPSNDDGVSEWRSAIVISKWDEAYTPNCTTCGIFSNLCGSSNFGANFPFSKSHVNSFPNINPQSLTGFQSTASGYYSRVTVTNKGTAMGIATPSTKEFAGGVNNVTIEVPRGKPYTLKFEFIEACSNCMSPGMLNLPQYGTGRRIVWEDTRNLFADDLNPTVYPRWAIGQYGINQLKNCN